MKPLPIDIVLPQLLSAVEQNTNVVLSAEPGGGKTTRVPVSLMDEQWLGGKKIIMLEPRRLAAIRSAEYMAEQRGEQSGGTIGYRIRGESRVGENTRLEVVTEGILTRMLQEDASLTDVGMVIFDEFHERSIHADLGLALTLDVQEQLRNDLKILVMSATIDGTAVSTLMGDCPVIKSEGRSFPVSVHYLSQTHDGAIEPLVVNIIARSLREDEGDLLVFLPGQREIRKVETLLLKKELPPNVLIHLLFGEASPEKQRSALNPAPYGKRKIILSTNIAETSLTIEGVRVVIDSGLSRSAIFDARRGMSGLVTVPVSQASADQRKGRAGRQQPGVCYRLWMESRQVNLAKYSPPEIVAADLAPLAMELARWGDGDGRTLKFLDRPPSSHLAQARELLRYLGALDKNGILTGHGKMMSAIPVHPRFAHMLIKGNERMLGELACDVAALLDERDILRGKNDADIDLYSRYAAMNEGKVSDGYSLQRMREQSKRLMQFMGLKKRTVKAQYESLGLLLALAYPERVAKRKSGERYQLAGNMAASLPKGSMLSKEEYLAVGEVDGAGSDIKIFLAESISKKDILELFADQIETKKEIVWDEKDESVVARSVTTFGSLEIAEKIFLPGIVETKKIMLSAIQRYGCSALPWNSESLLLRTRSEWLRRNSIVSNWIDLSDEHLTLTLENWLAPFLDGIYRRSQLAKLNMNDIVRSMFSYGQLQELDRLAPAHLTVPTGSSIPIDYSTDQPVLAVRLQEMFGETKTPTVGGGRVKVLLHLLSPARRPIAVTQDLPSFWKNAYVEVRKDMRGQYPKHFWPENPLEAEPTRRTKRAMEGKAK